MHYDTSSLYGSKSGVTDKPGAEVLSISELTRCIRGVIEAEDLFADVSVRGEISNLVKHSSGHVYLSLKDASALIRCVIWNGTARSIRLQLSEGMSVIARGRITVYEKQGQYQLTINEVKPDGVGALYVALEQLKSKLGMEGLFDESRKKPIPRFPRKLAIVTSPTAAALRDMVSIAQRRMPSANILLVPALMQGVSSEESVVTSLRLADSLPDVEVIILGRGGGSIEDLWTFNSEAIVRAIAACETPVVSAIGHETDYTLCDFVADLRAPTPSAAMELILPDTDELANRVMSMAQDMRASMDACLIRRKMRLDPLVSSAVFRYPERMLQDRWQSLDLLGARLANAFRATVSGCENRLGEVSAKLDSLSPLAVLTRGYGIVRSIDGSVVKSVQDVAVGDATETLISDGRLISKVIETREGWS